MSLRPRWSVLACLVLALAAPASAQRVEIEQWSAAWSPGFADDFADGVFASGPTEAYNVACGTANETGGRLVLGTATSPCTGFEVRPRALVPGGLVMRVLVSLPTVAEPTAQDPNPQPIPPTTQARVGIAVRNATGSDAVYLHVRRSNDVRQCQADPVCGPLADSEFGAGGNDVIYIELADEAGETIARTVTLTQNPTSSPDLPNAYELELTLTPSGTSLLPSGRWRECKDSYLSGGPCSAAVPLTALTPVAGPPATVSADGGALAAGQSHLPAFYASAPAGPFAMRIDDWDLAMGASDDFETAPLGSSAPYQTSTGVCGAASVGDGALALDASDGCPKVIAAFAGSLASEASASATLRYTLPARCEQRGVAFTAGADQANLALVRDADGSLALWLTSEPEAGDGPAIPLIERATLSETPESDAALAAVGAVELRLSLVPDGLGALLPHGEYRLCPSSPCEPAVAFVDLPPASFDPPLAGYACRVDLAERALPSDGGVLAADQPTTATLTLVPEPSAWASGVAAMLALRRRARRTSAVR